MNPIVSILLFFVAACGQAAEYRFQCFGEVTGLCDVVYDENGKATTVKIDYADPESAALFLALQKKRIYGTKAFEDHMGVKWEQKIILVGEFTSDTKVTEGGPTKAGAEPYRDFRMTGIKLAFPVWCFRDAAGDDVTSLPVFMEIHFGFDSLFPSGVKLRDKQIDLNKHVSANDPTWKK